MLYRLLRWLSAIALRWFYREILVEGLERVPVDGPVLIAGNHPNALIDALVIGCVVPRPVTITAKATLLDHPATRLLVRLVGIVPLRRASDEATRSKEARPDRARNAQAFDTILDALGEGRAILIFPEGKSHDDPHLAPLKTGLARVALQARDDRKIADLQIVPVGLTFEKKWQPRSRIAVHVGEPISIDAAGPATPDGVAALTTRLDERLREVTLNFDSRDDAERVLEVATLLSGVLADIRPLHDPEPPLPETIRLARRVDQAWQRVPELGAELGRRVEEFLRRLESLRDMAHANGIAVSDIGMDIRRRAGARFVVREAAIAASAGPLALWGRINHWIPLRLARWYALRGSRSPEDPAMYTIVGGLVFVLLFYAAQTLLVGALAGRWWALAYVFTLPISADWDFRYQERLERGAQRTRSYLRFRRDPAFHQWLLDEARWLRDEAVALDRAISPALEAQVLAAPR